jgi:SAM-dependent methyltransferase
MSADVAELRGARRAAALWRLFRNEREDPAPFYSLLGAELAADLDRRHGPLAGQRLLDLGCGPGWYTRALRDRGAEVVPIDNAPEELGPNPPEGALLADARDLPFPDGAVDGVVCSNLLEHTPDAPAVLREIGRVLRPGGWAYVSWTNWYSPHGGHDMSPYHLLGPRLGPRLYERRHGPPRKNAYGDGLWAVHIGPTLRAARAQPELEITGVEPRYWPRLRWIVRLPGLRELLTWNCVIHLERRPGADGLLAVLERVRDVPGWMSDDQAARLWAAAGRVPAGGRIVEIGSYHGRSAIVLASAAGEGVEVVAIDPHAGNDRGPRQWTGTADEGEADHRAFLANLARAGAAERVRHVRRRSQEALDAVDGPVDLLYVDGAHGYGPASDDLRRWGARVAPGGTLLVHDSWASVGVTLALLRVLLPDRSFTYAGRSRSLAEYRRAPAGAAGRVRSVLRQLGELPWFARNVLIKAAIVARLQPVARALGHREGPWPY